MLKIYNSLSNQVETFEPLEENKVKIEEKYGKYVELNVEWGRLEVEDIKSKKSSITMSANVYRLNGVYEYLGDEKAVTEYKKHEEWWRFLDETLDACNEIRSKLKSELGEEELNQRDKEMLGIIFIDAFLHKKRIDWEKWYRKNADCYMNEQQQEEEEKRLGEHKAEEVKLCYQECEKMEKDMLEGKINDLRNNPFFTVNPHKLVKGPLKELNRVRKIMLHMKKEYGTVCAKLTEEFVEKNNIVEMSDKRNIRGDIEDQFKKLTFGEVWEALSKKQRIDLEKWYKKEADYYKPLIANDN